MTDTEATSNERPLNIIVTEKHPLARAALVSLLGADGFHVLQAENVGAATFFITSVDHLAVLLVDLELQGWRSLVRYALTRGALVIAMEGDHPISEMYDLAQRGITACFEKPITYDEVRTAIKQNLAVQESSNLARSQAR